MPKRRNRPLAKKSPKPLTEGSFDLVAERFRVLGDPLRLRILQELQQGERSVGEITEATEATQANVSRHLQILLRARIVARRKEGLHVFYWIADRAVLELCATVCESLAAGLSRDLSAFRGRK